MALNFNEIPEGGKKYPQPDTGTVPARIVQIIDFGLQPQEDWETKVPTDPKERVYVAFELPTRRLKIEKDDGTIEDKPHWLGKEFTISTFRESNLMKMVAALKPEAEGMRDLLNVPCMVSIGRTSGGKAKITTITAPVEGLEVAELENETSYFDFDHPTKETFESCKPWQQKNIVNALNYKGQCDEWYTPPEDKKDY